MKLKIVLLLLISFLSEIKAQSSTDNLQKYWFYRERLVNNFTNIGLGQGNSLVANERYNQDKSGIFYGDEVVTQGFYISVLATEYALLKRNNQPTVQTETELYYALEALNRLDYQAETYWGKPPSLNGFFIRGDVPYNYVCNFAPCEQNTANCPPSDCGTNTNFNHFNSGKFASHPYFTQRGDIRATFSGLTLNQEATNTIIPNKAMYGNVDKYEDPLRRFPIPESIDQAIHAFMGLGLVIKLCDDNTTYAFSDGNFGVKAEAKKIMHRMLKHLQTYNWTLKNGATGGCDNMGITASCDHTCDIQDNLDCGNAFAMFSYPAAKMADHLLGTNEFYDEISSECHIKSIWSLFAVLAQTCNLQAIPKIHISSTAPYVTINPNENLININMCSLEMNKYLCMVALSNTAGDVTDPLFLAATYGLDPYALCNIPLVNYITENDVVVGTILSELSGRNSTSMETYPLIHQVLYGGPNPFISNSHYQSLMDSAPCKGPYKFKDNEIVYFDNYEWSSNNRFFHPQRRGTHSFFTGEYNGLDYMLLFNLYSLVQEDYVSNYQKTSMDINIPSALNFPVSLPFGGSFGTASNPAKVISFNTIEANNTISSNAHVTYKAADKVFLKSGFKTVNGAHFFATTEPIYCSNNSNPMYYRTVNTTDNLEKNRDTSSAFSTYIVSTYVVTNANMSYNEYSLLAATTKDERLKIKQKSPTSFSIYPNPNKGEFVLELSNAPKANYTLQITDAVGRSVMQQQFVVQEQNLKQNINLQAYGKGIYFVKINSEQINEVRKIVVE